MTKIITHAGNAHLDEVVACALAIVDRTWSYMDDGSSLERAFIRATDIGVERREPSAEELEDPQVLVLDVGGRYEPEKGNFDHHQLDRGIKESAMSLYAASVGLPDGAFDGVAEYVPGAKEYPGDSLASFMEDAFPWFRTRVMLDACGPFATAKYVGTEWGTVKKFLGPFEDVVLKAFENAGSGDRVDVVRPLAEMILRKHAAWHRVVHVVKYDRPWWGNGELTIADFTSAVPDDAEACSDMLTRHVRGVAVFHDNRGKGLTLLRLRDDPRVDFTIVRDDPEVAFCHAGGFIVKTKTKNLDEAWRLIEDSYT